MIIHPSYLPAYEDGTECPETSAYKIQTLGDYPKENIQHSEHGESLKSRDINVCGEIRTLNSGKGATQERPLRYSLVGQIFDVI
jgi:hypothetical protein